MGASPLFLIPFPPAYFPRAKRGEAKKEEEEVSGGSGGGRTEQGRKRRLFSRTNFSFAHFPLFFFLPSNVVTQKRGGAKEQGACTVVGFSHRCACCARTGPP